MIQWLGFTTPALATLGLLAIAAPIVIHLLNRRRFKIVDWAAMEFLLDADKKNRRRVRLENLLLLVLRCLGILLIGLILARPFLKSAWTGRFIDSPRFERIVLFDDSLSMQALSDNQSAIDQAKRGLIEMLREWATNDSDDALTLILTSRPDAPVIHGEPVTPDTIEQRVLEVDQLQSSDGSADLDVALHQIQQILARDDQQRNHVVYLLSDMRQRDWKLAERAADENRPLAALQQIAENVSGCFVIDVAGQRQNNLAVTQIRPEATLIANVVSRFDVTVANLGDQPVNNLRVRLSAGEAIPLLAPIERIRAGESETVQFNFQFAPEPNDEDREAAAALVTGHETTQVQMTAQVVADDPQQVDQLLTDSQRFFAARVARGIPTLVVDGDPSSVTYRSESFFLRPALDPPGTLHSGIVADVVTDTELESATVSGYQVIFLCNVYRLSDAVVDSLRQWTRAGGGLVILPGDQVNDVEFNRQLFDTGQGLSPLRLDSLRGDESHRSWVNFQIEQPIHLALRIFEDQNNPFLDRVKIFRWWKTSIPKPIQNRVSVLARFTGDENSVAIAEKAFGNGRVIALAIPGDADWTNWTDDPSFLITMQELVRYLAGNSSSAAELRVGQPLRQPLDLVEFRETAQLQLPDEQRLNVQAVHHVHVPENEEPAESLAAQPVRESTIRQIEFAGVDHRGFYALDLTRTNGDSQQLLFAANVDPSEGDLRKTDSDLLRQLAGKNIKIVESADAAAQTLRGSRSEIWRYLLVAAICILGGEQFLGWFFGQRR